MFKHLDIKYHTINNTTLSPCGKYILTIYNKCVSLWDIENNKYKYLNVNANYEVFARLNPIFTNDSKYFVVSHYVHNKHFIEIWNVDEGKVIDILSVSNNENRMATYSSFVSISNCNSFLLITSYEKVYIYNINTKLLKPRYIITDNVVYYANFSSCSNYILTNSRDSKNACLWNVNDLSLVCTYVSKDIVFSSCFSKCGKYVLLGCDKSISLYELTVNKKVINTSLSTVKVKESVQYIKLPYDNTYYVIAYSNRETIGTVLQIKDNTFVKKFTIPLETIPIFSSCNKYVITTCHNDIIGYELSTGNKTKKIIYNRPTTNVLDYRHNHLLLVMRNDDNIYSDRYLAVYTGKKTIITNAIDLAIRQYIPTIAELVCEYDGCWL